MHSTVIPFFVSGLNDRSVGNLLFEVSIFGEFCNSESPCFAAVVGYTVLCKAINLVAIFDNSPSWSCKMGTSVYNRAFRVLFPLSGERWGGEKVQILCFPSIGEEVPEAFMIKDRGIKQWQSVPVSLDE